MIISYIFQKGHILNTMMIMKYPKRTLPWIFQGDFTHSKRVDFRGEVSSLCPQVLTSIMGQLEEFLGFDRRPLANLHHQQQHLSG